MRTVAQPQPQRREAGEDRDGNEPARRRVRGQASPRASRWSSHWTELVGRLKLGGMARMLAQHSELTRWDGDRRASCACRRCTGICSRSLTGTSCKAALEEHFGRRLRVEFTLGQPAGHTPAELEDRERQVKQREAVQAIDSDPFVRELVENFDARVVG